MERQVKEEFDFFDTGYYMELLETSTGDNENLNEVFAAALGPDVVPKREWEPNGSVWEENQKWDQGNKWDDNKKWSQSSSQEPGCSYNLIPRSAHNEEMSSQSPRNMEIQPQKIEIVEPSLIYVDNNQDIYKSQSPFQANPTPIHPQPGSLSYQCSSLSRLLSQENLPRESIHCLDVYEKIDQNGNLQLIKKVAPPKKKKSAKKSILADRLKNVTVNDAKKATNPEILDFQRRLRKHRTELGLTQQEAARSIFKLVGKKISQTLISRFETNQLHPKNTINLIPDMEKWMQKSSIISTRSLIL